MTHNRYSDLPDARDGLNGKERIVLQCIDKLSKELGRSDIPTPMLYGRVVEYVDMSVTELQSILQKLTGATSNRGH